MKRDDDFSWKTDDGESVYARRRRVDGRARAAVCLVHGIGEHSGRYADAAERFTEAGISFYTFDLRGHGASSGKRGHTPSFERLFDDVDRIVAEARAAEGEESPVFVWGHSMGGTIALNHALIRDPAISGLIVTSPYLRLGREPSALESLLARLMSLVLPSVTFEMSLDVQALARVPGVAEAYRADPLTHGSISARWFVAARNAARFALDHATELRYSVLLMHGTADALTSVAGSREFSASLGDRCTYREFRGAYHELHNDVVKDEAYREILTFVERTCAHAQIHGS